MKYYNIILLFIIITIIYFIAMSALKVNKHYYIF